ncbi:hypothetical protein B0H10DRAFT_1940425 [Mycena sp. CBHHK59/15]|nr:hypothetical protein B0H10DRAFT_1940425 [Mycena sp. CBHHK59/15]
MPSDSDTGQFASHLWLPSCSAIDSHAGLTTNIPGSSEMRSQGASCAGHHSHSCPMRIKALPVQAELTARMMASLDMCNCRPGRRRWASPCHTVSNPEIEHITIVAGFLNSCHSSALNDNEVTGIVTFLTTAQHIAQLQWRQTARPHAASPARRPSPRPCDHTQVFGLGLGADSMPPTTPNLSPHKTLAKNPNGVYCWSGGSSVRPSKNRYTSPAFGMSHSMPEWLFHDPPVLATPQSDTKRRRLVDPTVTTTPSMCLLAHATMAIATMDSTQEGRMRCMRSPHPTMCCALRPVQDSMHAVESMATGTPVCCGIYSAWVSAEVLSMSTVVGDGSRS